MTSVAEILKNSGMVGATGIADKHPLLDKLSKRELLLERIDQRLSDLKASSGNADLEAFLRALVEVAPAGSAHDSYQTAEIFHPNFQIVEESK